MDLDEWEFIPDDGFLDYHEAGEKKKLSGQHNSYPKGVFNMNYFICPSPPTKSQKIIETSGNSRVPANQLVQVPIQLDPTIIGKVPNDELEKEITVIPMQICVMPPAAIPEKIRPPDIGGAIMEADQDTVSQVFFKNFKKETDQFVDMKMDSPKSGNRGIMPQIDAGAFQFDDKGDALENKSSPRKKIEKEKMEFDTKEEEDTWEEENSGGLNLWKWSMSGVGAICSFGVAAATICILVFGSHQKNKNQQNQKLHFQIYTDDKRIKQVVQQASKLNEAISTARGAPQARAHITYGGYYHGL